MATFTIGDRVRLTEYAVSIGYRRRPGAEIGTVVMASPWFRVHWDGNKWPTNFNSEMLRLEAAQQGAT